MKYVLSRTALVIVVVVTSIISKSFFLPLYRFGPTEWFIVASFAVVSITIFSLLLGALRKSCDNEEILSVGIYSSVNIAYLIGVIFVLKTLFLPASSGMFSIIGITLAAGFVFLGIRFAYLILFNRDSKDRIASSQQ